MRKKSKFQQNNIRKYFNKLLQLNVIIIALMSCTSVFAAESYQDYVNQLKQQGEQTSQQDTPTQPIQQPQNNNMQNMNQGNMNQGNMNQGNMNQGNPNQNQDLQGSGTPWAQPSPWNNQSTNPWAPPGKNSGQQQPQQTQQSQPQNNTSQSQQKDQKSNEQTSPNIYNTNPGQQAAPVNIYQ